MPSVSPAQRSLMAKVAINRHFAKAVNIPQSVGREYAAADAGLLKNFRVKKRKVPRRIVPHSQTHAVPFGTGPDDGVA